MVFLVGHLGHVIADFFGDGSVCGVRAHYSYEDEPLGRGGALKRGLILALAGALAGDEPVFAANGDIITDASLDALLADYRARRQANPAHLATILTAPMTSPYGIVDTDENGLVSRFREKAALPYALNAGVYVLHPAIRDLLPDVGDHETTTFPTLAETGRMSAVPTNAFWRSVDSPQDLREAEEHIAGHTVGAGAHRAAS